MSAHGAALGYRAAAGPWCWCGGAQRGGREREHNEEGRRWRGANETNKMFGTPQDTYFGAITGGRQVKKMLRGVGGRPCPRPGKRPQGKHRPQPRNPAAWSPGTN